MRKLPAALAAVLLLVSCGLLAQRHLYEVPVLMYHLIDTPTKGSSLYVSPDSFERQMEFLKLHRYHVVSLERLMTELKSGRSLPSKTVVITFDDGTIDNFRNAFPVLKKMGFPAAIFMITGNIGRPGWLNAEDLRILDESGVTIGSHTANHAFLPDLTIDQARQELMESKQTLEALLGHEVKYFSYPAGGGTPEIRQAVIDAGYAGAVTTNYFNQKHDPYALHRIKVGDSARNLFNFWIKTSGFYRLGKKTVAYRTPWKLPASSS